MIGGTADISRKCVGSLEAKSRTRVGQGVFENSCETLVGRSNDSFVPGDGRKGGGWVGTKK